MVDFQSLKTHVNSALVKDSTVLRLDRTSSSGALKSGSFLGRLAAWLRPQTEYATSRGENLLVKDEVLKALMGKFEDRVLNAVTNLIDWSADTPLTARDVRVLIKTAEQLRTHDSQCSGGHPYFSEANRLGRLERLGRGAVNDVSLGTWLDCSDARPMVFKPLIAEAPDSFVFGGIRTSGNDVVAGGNIAGRNIASYETAHALRMPGLIVETLRTRQDGVDGILMAHAPGLSVLNVSGRISVPLALDDKTITGRLNELHAVARAQGLVVTGFGGGKVRFERASMDEEAARVIRAMQESCRDEGVEISSDGEVIAPEDIDIHFVESVSQGLHESLDRVRCINVLPLGENQRIVDGRLNLLLNRLQWLDFVCAQTDRNPGNLFIDYDGQGRVAGLTGIDNDASFGETVDKAGVRSLKDGALLTGSAFQGMPEVIDEETAEAIFELSSTDRERYTDMLLTNALTPEEVRQALLRLDQCVAFIASDASPILPADSKDWAEQNRSGYSAYLAGAVAGLALHPRRLYDVMSGGG